MVECSSKLSALTKTCKTGPYSAGSARKSSGPTGMGQNNSLPDRSGRSFSLSGLTAVGRGNFAQGAREGANQPLTAMNYGQDLAKRMLSEYLGPPSHENYRPSWLHGLEIDIYWESLRIAVEFQGDQHYVPVFGYSSFNSQVRNDRSKKRMLSDLGITLIRIQAIDLEYTRLNRILRRSGQRYRKPEGSALRNLRALNKEATSYRKTLRINYTSMTCTRRRSKTRRAAVSDTMARIGVERGRCGSICHPSGTVPKPKWDEAFSLTPKSESDVKLTKSTLRPLQGMWGHYKMEVLEKIGVPTNPTPFKWRQRIMGTWIPKEIYDSAQKIADGVISIHVTP